MIIPPVQSGRCCSPGLWSIPGHLPRKPNPRGRAPWLSRGGMRSEKRFCAMSSVIKDDHCPYSCSHHMISKWRASTAWGPLVPSGPGKELNDGLWWQSWRKREGGTSSTDTGMSVYLVGKGTFMHWFHTLTFTLFSVGSELSTEQAS